jgi:STE24 endopeptidase
MNRYKTVIAVALLLLATAAFTQAQSTLVSASGAPAFDVKAATDAYLNSVPPADRVRSDAYFEGGYWLILWDFLFGAVVALALLFTRISSNMRAFAERTTGFKPLQTFLYWVQYFILTTVVSLPLSIYEGFFRERKYGLMNQTLRAWSGDQLIMLVVGVVLGGVLVMALFGVVRRFPSTWSVWATAVSIIFLMFFALIGPVYIAPLFNKYTKLQNEKVRGPILSLARASGVPATEVWEVDASKQSKRVSANVSGFLGTERITLNDNLLNRCTPEEIEAVMGHEMGHYVLNHVYKGIVFFTLEILIFFAFLRGALRWSLARRGERWGIRDIGDPAVLPLVMLIASIFFFVLTPVNNTYSRTDEYEADIFGLNAAGQPDGEAKVDLMLGEYRKLDPGPIEEFVFFDHPSGRTRITAAMRYKAEHLKPVEAAAPVQPPITAAPHPAGAVK